MRLAQKNKLGFTLIELIVVFAITAVLSLIAVGTYANFRKNRQIRSAAESINSVFVAARSYAIATGQWHRVVFQMENPSTSAEQYSFWVDQIDPFTSLDPAPSVPEPAVKPKITTPDFLPERVRISDIEINTTSTTYQYPADPFVIGRFFPDGSSDMITVHLLQKDSDPNVDSNYFTIKVYPPTGQAKIFPDEKR
jgi:prepilin-type N-terminal cleavage/methylation domain-containing protein